MGKTAKGIIEMFERVKLVHLWFWRN